MPFNGSGTYTLPAGNPVTTGTTISSTTTNSTNSDIATALSNCVTRDGQSPATANLPLGGFKVTGLAAGSSNGDSVSYEQVQYLANVGSAGTSGQVLTSAGTGAPTWTSQSDLTANIAGGVQGSIPYQTGVNTTGLLAPGTSGQVLASGGSGAAPTWQTLSLTIPSVQVFTSSGTWTCPSNVSRIKITVVGGGGSGGTGTSQGGVGGGGGGTAIKTLTVSAGTTYTVTVGAGGAGVTTSGNNNGNAGGTSSFSGTGITTVSATGGSGGNVSTWKGSAGLGQNGDLNIKGGDGSGLTISQSTPLATGGSSFFCGNTAGNTNIPQAYGGGSGSSYNASSTYAGADGVVVVEY